MIVNISTPVSKEDALKFAKNYDTRINHYIEYENAFCFGVKDGIMREGGAPWVVLLKETAELMLAPEYLLTGKYDVVEIESNYF